MKPRATLVTFAVGRTFERYAEALLASARDRFFPGRPVDFLVLQSTPRWPYVARDRHPVILRERARVRGEFVLLLDADLLFEGTVDDEVVADGITACLHPVQNELPVERMTYERNPASSAYVPFGAGGRYYLGGVVGGTREAFLDLSAKLSAMVEADGDYCPVWQDEGYLNRHLIDEPPALELDERYCAWPSHKTADVRIRALDKTPDEFRERDALGNG